MKQEKKVYNGPTTSNLSQQQQQKFWSKVIFEQQIKKISRKKIGKNKIWRKKIEKKKLKKYIHFFR